MNAITKFLEMYYRLPEKARTELVYDYPVHPITLRICQFEILNNTKTGKKILEKLGFTDD